MPPPPVLLEELEEELLGRLMADELDDELDNELLGRLTLEALELTGEVFEPVEQVGATKLPLCVP